MRQFRAFAQAGGLKPLIWSEVSPLVSGQDVFDGLRRRLDEAGGEFAELVRGIRDRQAWDTAFVDATCDPPETFTFGGAVAHVLTWDAYRRHVLAATLRDRGVDVSADPIAWERAR